MTGDRGKREKTDRGGLSLGLKQVLLGGGGVLVLMVLSFVLGTMAGRGEIYRALQSWGLMSPETPKAVHALAPGGSPSPSAPAGAPPGAQPAAKTPPAPAAAETKTAPKTPQKAALVPANTTPALKKKPKEGTPAGDRKAKEEELQKMRQDVAPKLKFQNSLDGQPAKKAAVAPKGGKGAPKQVMVARFRDHKAAKARLAEMQKKGDKVTLQSGKDQEGPYYVLYRQIPAAPRETKNTEPQAKKKPQSKRKQQPEQE